MPSRRRPQAEHREPCRLEWQPVGNGARALILAVGTDTGATIDIDTLDLSRAEDRQAYAVRACARFGTWGLEQLDAELLRIAVARCAVEPEPEAPAPTLGDALGEWRAHETVPVICTGFQPLDSLAAGELPGGLPLGQIVALLGRPGCGKSALSLQLVLGALIGDPDLRAVWAAGEMSLEALARRSIAVGSVLLGMPAVPMRAAGRRTADAQAVADELQRQIGERLSIVQPVLTVPKIEAAVAASGARLVVIDYLQLVRHEGAADSRHEAEAVLSGLRTMAPSLGCAMIIVGSMPKASDGSARIGTLFKNTNQGDHDCDIVLQGEADEQTDENGLRPVAWKCRKHRHGSPRDLQLVFDGSAQTFFDAEAPAPDEAFADFAMPGGRR
jgi:KaiC/GvpD/RAD55 family RecA-like ATPase